MSSTGKVPPLGHRRSQTSRDNSNEGLNKRSSNTSISGADRTVTFVDTIQGEPGSRESNVLLQEDSSDAQTSRSHSSISTYATSHASDGSSVNPRDLKGDGRSSNAVSGSAAAGENSAVRSKGSNGSARSSSSSSGGKRSGSSKDREARAAQKERIASTKRFMKEKYSTTSTIYATQSIECPDFPRAMFCIACIMQAVMFDYIEERAALGPPPQFYDSSSGCDQSVSSGLSGGGCSWKDSDEDTLTAARCKHKELRIFPQLPYHLGGVQDPSTISNEVLEKETMNDPALRERVLAGDVPTIDTILRFITWLHQSAAYSAECNIIAFIYIKRIIGEVELRMDNWRGVWTGAVILAQKVWDDRPLRTSSFTKVLPGVERTQLRDLEMKFFNLLNFSTNVRPSVYARYYFELREIFKCLVGPEANVNARKKPLSILNAKLMEKRTSPTLNDNTAVRTKARATAEAAEAARAEQQQQLAFLRRKQQEQQEGAPESRGEETIAGNQQQHEEMLQRTPYSQHQGTPAMRERIGLMHQTSLSSTGTSSSEGTGTGGGGGSGKNHFSSFAPSAPSSAPVSIAMGAGHSKGGKISASATNSPAVHFSKLGKLKSQRTKTTDDLEDLPIKPSFYVLS